MATSDLTEVNESNAQLYRAWGQFASKFPRADVSRLPGIDICWAGAKWPMLNMVGLSAPVRDLGEFEKQVGAATRFTASKPETGMLVVCQQLLPAGAMEEAGAIAAKSGWVRALTLRGMVAEKLEPLRRPCPQLEYRRATDWQTSRDLLDLNAMSYNAPLEFGREVSDISGYWDGSFAYVGYKEGRAVTAASTLLVEGCLYAGWVATHPDARRQGYAEAAMRHSLHEASRASGLSRTVLHASELGYPIYKAMGYREVAFFEVYFPEALVKALAAAH